MLKQLLSNNRIFGGLVCLLVFIAAGLIYLQSVKRPASLDLPPPQKSVEQKLPTTPKPPAPGETAESGHWHGNEWHTEPHAQRTEKNVPLEASIQAEVRNALASASLLLENPDVLVDQTPLAESETQDVLPTDLASVDTEIKVLRAEKRILYQLSKSYGVKVKEHLAIIKAHQSVFEEHRSQKKSILAEIKAIQERTDISAPEKNELIEEFQPSLKEQVTAISEQMILIEQQFEICETYRQARDTIGKKMDELNDRLEPLVDMIERSQK